MMSMRTTNECTATKRRRRSFFFMTVRITNGLILPQAVMHIFSKPLRPNFSTWHCGDLLIILEKLDSMASSMALHYHHRSNAAGEFWVASAMKDL